jgi:hypothetical protein
VYVLIIFDNVCLKGCNGREYTLSFHIPIPGITLIITPYTISENILADLITGLKKPRCGSIIYSVNIKRFKIYNPKMCSGKYIVVNKLFEALGEEDFLEKIPLILETYGLKYYSGLKLGDLPENIAKFLCLLYILRSEGDTYILIDPFNDLNDELIENVLSEIYSLRIKGKAIVILSRNSLLSRIINYDNMVKIESNGAIKEYSSRTFRIENYFEKSIPVMIYIRELKGIYDILSLECINGFLKSNRNYIILLINKHEHHKCLSYLSTLMRKRIIRGLRVLGK